MTVYSHTDRQRSPAGNRRLAKKRVQYLNDPDSYRDCTSPPE